MTSAERIARIIQRLDQVIDELVADGVDCADLLLVVNYLVEVAAEIERDACCADARQMDLKVVP